MHSDVPDKHIWDLPRSGQYSAKLAYDALFQGAVNFGPLEYIGNLGHLENAVSFSGSWLIRAVGQMIGCHGEVSLILRFAHFVIKNQDHPTPFGVMCVCQAIPVRPFAESWAYCSLPSTLGEFF